MAEYISYIYQVIDKFSPAMKRIYSANEKFVNGIKRSQKVVGKIGQKLTGLQTMAYSAAGAIGGKATLDKFVSFDSAMNKLESVTFAGEDQMARMRDMAKQLGATTQFTAGEAAQGMSYLAMAGLDTEKVLQAIPGALQLAAAGGIELGQAADIATNVLGQMGLEVEDLTRVNNVLAAAQSKANFNVIELFEAMRPIGTTASNLGMSLEELTAHLGAMANAGEKGSIAGTLLRNALTNIAGASKRQKSIYKALGINLGEFVNKAGKITNFKGLIAELQKLDKQGKLTVPILQELYGDRGFRAMQILAGAGAESIDKLQQSITGTNAAVESANIQMKGLPGVLKSMSSAFEAVIIAIFESGLDKILIDMSNEIIKIARAINAANPQMLKLAGIIGLIATVAGPILVIFGLIATAIGAISAPMLAIGAALAAVGAAVYEVYKNWDYLVMDFQLGIEAVLGFIESMKTGFIQTFEDIGKAFDFLVNNFKEAFPRLTKFFGTASKFVGKLWNKNEAEYEAFSGAGAGVVAKNTIASKSTLNGDIVVSAKEGSKVESAGMKTNAPGNLGFNLMGAMM